VTIWGRKHSEFNLQRPKPYKNLNNREGHLVTDSSICTLRNFHAQISISCLRKHIITGQLRHTCHSYWHHQKRNHRETIPLYNTSVKKPIAFTSLLVLCCHIIAQTVVHKLSLELHFVIQTYIHIGTVINGVNDPESQVTISGKSKKLFSTKSRLAL
jgi:hypothetical protein